MNGLKRAIYRSMCIFPLRVYRRMFLKMHVWGRDHIPKGPKIFVANHIASNDAAWVLPDLNECVHFVIGPGYQSRWHEVLLDTFEQVNCMPAHRHTVVAKSAEYLRRGGAIYICPEGDMQELFHLGRFYDGVGRIFRESRAPIVPIAVVAPGHSMREYPRQANVIEGRVYRQKPVVTGTFCTNIGEPFYPELTGDSPEAQDRSATDQIKARIEVLMQDVRMNKYWV